MYFCFLYRNILKVLWKYWLSLEYKPSAFLPTNVVWFQNSLKELINPLIFRPPFWEDLHKVYPGKAHHILEIYHGSAYIDQGWRTWGKTVHYPYLAQPLVELALSIPVSDLFGEDYDRILFRKAISQFFNTDLVWRKSKGETTGIFQLGIPKNLKRTQELCLEGKFSQNKLVNTEILNNCINLIKQGQIKNSWPLTNLLAAEIWFEAWG